MKKFLVVLLLVVLVAPVFAQGDRVMSLRQSISETLRVNTFDNLVRSTNYSNATGKHAAPNDIVSTGTASVAYLGTVKAPLLLRVQNTNTAAGKIHFKEYATNAVGLASTVAADPFLSSPTGAYISTYTSGELGVGEVWEKVYYAEPDLVFGGVGTTTFTIQVFKQSAE